MSLEYRLLSESECEMAAMLEGGCLVTAWNKEQIAQALVNPNAVYIGAFENGSLCGIASAYCVFGDAEIMNIAVLREKRRRGIGMGLLQALENALAEMHCELITLEVAEDNASAASLYGKFGFVPVGKRKNFYKDTDAIIMQKK